MTTTTSDASLFSTFLVTTTTETITFHRSRTSAYSEAAVGDTAPRTAAVGCSFELHEPAVIVWAAGGSWTGGLVLFVVQVADTEFVPAP
ncbi:hypothetical protein [Cryobacterium sp. SO1]|uniref:hypothetical protein n=1 Tax=Cryobacterium sp. SO1 TaxID=1897061 RepID=UPI0010232596|nr:hypothetical protein [Cryobacterium sp. SO1]RZI36973.1 hypothetical protein BJQ95_00640 [Cryobacterium sp. SO1]